MSKTIYEYRNTVDYHTYAPPDEIMETIRCQKQYSDHREHHHSPQKWKKQPEEVPPLGFKKER